MKNISRIIALLIILSMIFTGCSNEKSKTIVIEDESNVKDIANKDNDDVNNSNEKDTNNEVKVDLSLSSVNKIYEIYSFDKNSNVEKRPIGWLDDTNVINWVSYIPQNDLKIKEEMINDILDNNYISKSLRLGIFGNHSGSFYLEKYNYRTGESEKIFDFKTFANAEFTWFGTTNDGKKILITEYNDKISIDEIKYDDKIKYKELKEKGKVYIYDLKTNEKKFISDVDVLVHSGRISSWSNKGRYAIFLKDIIKNDEDTIITYKIGIYDTVKSKVIEYEYKKYKSENDYYFAPTIQVTDKGKIFFGYKFAFEQWGYLNDDELFRINPYPRIGWDIIKDIDKKSVMTSGNSVSTLNLEDGTRKHFSEDISIFHDISEDGKYIAYKRNGHNKDVLIAELNNDGISNVNLLYKLTENMNIISMKLSSDNKKLLLLVNENEERIKELVIELK